LTAVTGAGVALAGGSLLVTDELADVQPWPAAASMMQDNESALLIVIDDDGEQIE
jgi:hypothetical protein